LRPLNFGDINPLNTELNPIYHLLALLVARHIFHVSGLRVNSAPLHTIGPTVPIFGNAGQNENLESVPFRMNQ